MPLHAMLVVVLLALLPAHAAETDAVPAPRWELVGSRSFEPEHPGLGTSRTFRSDAGVVTAYVYDLRRTWSADLDDPAFVRHFDSTIEEIRHFERRGDYANVEVGPVSDVAIGGATFRTVAIRLERAGRPHESRTFLAVIAGKLVKYRMTFTLPTAMDVDAIAQRFIEENLRAASPQKRTRGVPGPVPARVTLAREAAG